jgi:hypothetical protein
MLEKLCLVAPKNSDYKSNICVYFLVEDLRFYCSRNSDI